MWFKNRRAKWRKRERNAMNAAAAAAADFKSSFSPQFNGLMQPFGDDALYAAGYHAAATGPQAAAAYNSWAGKVPSPLAGTAKSFPWGLNSVNMSPLSGMSTQSGINSLGSCFNTPPGVNGGINGINGINGGSIMPAAVAMGNTLGSMSSQAGTPCMHYGSPSNPYNVYGREQCPPPPPPPGHSLSALRFKSNIKSNNSVVSSSGLVSYAPVSPRSTPGLTACQYAAAASDRSPL